MHWIFDNLQVVFALAAAFAYWLSQRKREAEENAAGREESDGPEGPRDFGVDIEEAERTRRIQEEIRRKIAQRMGHEPAPVAPPPLVREFAPAVPPVVVTSVPTYAAANEALLQRQRDLAEQLQAAEAARRAARRSRTSAAMAQTSPNRGPETAGSWKEQLRGKDSLRRAIVLREVLGPPVGLR